MHGRHFDFSTFFFRALSAKVAIGWRCEASFGRVRGHLPSRKRCWGAQSGSSTTKSMLGTVNGLVQESLMSLLSLRGSRGSHQAAQKLARHFAKSVIFACLSHQKVGFNFSECISELGCSVQVHWHGFPRKKSTFEEGQVGPSATQVSRCCDGDDLTASSSSKAVTSPTPSL